ncbi:MAG: hypothetical protein II819_05320 [Fibrobacter sp.]|nr:hypothetical protein [Fibrobacter sp.]
MDVRRTKRESTTVDMLRPGEVFEENGRLLMLTAYVDHSNLTAVTLVDGELIIYPATEEWEVTVVPGAFVPEG